jgi:hypothetical protein
MEPFPFHYACHVKSDDSVDPTVKFVFEELQKMEVRLGDCIEGCCHGIERRMADAEQRVEERLVLLEMARTELETDCTKIEKRMEGLKLEVHRVGCFLEHGSLGDPQGRPGIFGTTESTPHPSPSTCEADGPSGHRVEHSPQNLEFGLVFTHTQVPVNGTSKSKPPICVVDAALDHLCRSQPVGDFA